MSENEMQAIADMFGFPLSAEQLPSANSVQFAHTPDSPASMARRAKRLREDLEKLEASQRITHEIMMMEFNI